MLKHFFKIISNNLFYVGLGMILVYHLPYIVFGENSWFNFGYDSLDSSVIWNVILVQSGKIFANNSDVIPSAMGGLPRLSYPGEFSIELWLYYFFTPISAYIINIINIAVLAYFGMFFLLKKLSPNSNIYILVLVSVLYALLPFYPHVGLSVAGIPLIIYGLINANEKPVISYGILVLYVLYSAFTTTGIFLLSSISVYLMVKLISKRRVSKNEVLYVLVLFLLYLVTNYRLILSVVYPDFISHRTDFVIPTNSFSQSLYFFFNLVFKEYGHNTVIKLPVIISVTVLLLLNVFYNRMGLKNNRMIYYSILIILILSFLAVLFQYKRFYDFYTQMLPFAKQIQLQRFYWLLPPVYYVLYLFTLQKLNVYKYGKYFIVFIFIVHFGLVIHKNAMIKQMIKTEIFEKKTGSVSYEAFYSEDLYHSIDKFIGKDKSSYRVASIGLQPATALYNGFYTVDGYYSFGYPKSYKDLIFNIIKPELLKDSSLYYFYMDWGSVCLIPSSELISQKFAGRGYIVPVITKMDGYFDPIKNLDLNFSMLKNDLNCQYIFSALPIENSTNSALVYLETFEDEESAFRVYLYQIVD